ncbi:MAG: hypothetical protein ABEJ75_01720, partial [Candidatus Nanohaloarchaea archaeon]
VIAMVIITRTGLHEFFHAKPLPLWAWGIVIGTEVIGGVLAIAISKLVTHLVGEYSETEY